MGKFVIECPKCGRYAEAKTGFFAKKRVDCSCGYTINVKTDKLNSRTCPHCGNVVVYDQSKGEKAACPVCHKPINTLAQNLKLREFACRQCGVRLQAVEGTEHFTCPVCDCVNDVAERIKMEQIKHDGLASIIKYEGDNETLVWKHPIEDFNCGSQLIVHESQEAIFFRDGQALDLFGAGRYTLETQQLPMLEKLYKLPTDTEGTFHSEVYYINLTTQMGIKWGTDSKIRLFDPMTGMHVELGASGEFSIRVNNSRKFLLKVVGTAGGFKQDQLMGHKEVHERSTTTVSGNTVHQTQERVEFATKGYFKTMVMTQVKSFLAAAIRENNISVLEIDERLMELSEALREKINVRLGEYGLEMPEFFIARVVLPDDKNFQRMRDQFAQQYLDVRQQQIETQIARAEAEKKAAIAAGNADVTRITAQADADAYRMKAAAQADEMRMKGYTYQQETARNVGMEAMKNGITGGEGGGAGALGSIAGLGMALGTMGTVVNMTKDAMNPMVDAGAQMGQTAASAISGGWDCACGQKNIASNFCPNCGTKKPDPAESWECACGQRGITSNFCPNCGTKKPEPAKGWDCECGQKNIVSNFCPNCGTKKPEEDAGWDCPECEQKGIKSNFCPNCGHKKD